MTTDADDGAVAHDEIERRVGGREADLRQP
jgi:hypothetical protein